MKGNAELLTFIYQNAEMGTNTLKQILEIVENEKLKKQLTIQLDEYKKFQNDAQRILEERGFDEKGINSFDKIKTYLMINIQTLTDKSTSHIAEMLIIGSNMGIIDAIKNLHKYQEAEGHIIKLMERLLKTEESNVEKLKAFL
ncbi:hypothetical protein ACTQ6A_09510 [Lachnospiraceae bacterium LCP25S3_G4]